MITLQNNRQFPPGGWQYVYVPGDDVEAALVLHMGPDMEHQIKAIQSYRRANPQLNLPTDRVAAQQSLFEYTYGRLKNRYSLDVALKWFKVDGDEGAINEEYLKKNELYIKLSTVGDARRADSDYDRGLRTLYDWVGEGAHPVGGDIANHRARVCAACPLNQPDDNWLSRLAGALSHTVRAAVALKEKMKLETVLDDRLHICKACSCQLKLKVWVPMETILSEMTTETFNKLHEKCWIRE